ncbi:MAG: flagellar hook-length control protein FliK [Lachnobacterium sp.]|nr:flagellar hook-length control protein FliK [Lachnobacterium sp.]
MQISNLYDKYNNINNQKLDTNINAKNVGKTSTIQDMKAGDVFEGTVVSVKNDKVSIALSDGQKIEARLDNGVQVAPGQSLFFEVKSASTSTIEIRPYSSGTEGNNPILANALKEASIDVNVQTLKMVQEMMHEGLPIDKESLAKMYRQIVNFSNIDVKTVVQMTKFDIPITEQRAYQFENYLNDKQAITNKLNDVLNNLVKNISDPSIPIKQIESNNVKLLDIVSKGLENVKVEQFLDKEEVNMLLDKIMQIEGQQDEGKDFLKMIKMFQSENAKIAENRNVLAETSINKGEVLAEEENVIALEKNDMTSIHSQEKNADTQTKSGGIQNENIDVQNNSQNVDTKNPDLSTLNQEKQTIDGNVQKSENLNSNFSKLEVADILNQIKSLMNNPAVSEKDILSLILSKEYKGFVESIIKEQWLIEPEQLKENGKITQLYKKLDYQITQIEELVNAVSQNKTALMSTISEIRGNLDFMNQVNNIYNYVQIPLKMTKQDVNGELYLYTNRKNLKEKKGELSAFLHLELDNLGTTDVSIKLKDKNLKTNFFVEDDTSYDLIFANLPMLLSKLNKLGYACTLEVVNEKKKINFVEDFLKKDLPTAGPVKRFSFDMRA